MDQAKTNEFLVLYEYHKKQRGSLPTKRDILLEMVKVFMDSTTKADKKRAAKMLNKNKDSLIKFNLWKYVDENY